MAAFIAFTLALAAVYLGALVLTGVSFGATGPTGPTGQPPVAPVRPVAPPCKKVSARVYNRRLKTLDTLTAYRHKRKSKPVCRSEWRKLLAQIKKARADCIKEAGSTEASVYWPGADSGGMTGSCGRYLGNYRFGYAELGMGRYLGGLRCFTRLWIERAGRVVSAIKLDIGGGSGSSRRGIDLWDRTGPALGISGIGNVRYSTRNCWRR